MGETPVSEQKNKNIGCSLVGRASMSLVTLYTHTFISKATRLRKIKQIYIQNYSFNFQTQNGLTYKSVNKTYTY